MALHQMLSAIQKITNQRDYSSKDATSAFRKFQLELIRTGHKLTEPADLKAAMEGLELGAQIALSTNNLEMFDRTVIQLKQYYLIEAVARTSTQREHLMGLYLMYLLTESRLGDFHVEIELLSFADLESKFIKYPLTVEQLMMEGSYGQIIQSKAEQPNKTYSALMNKLEETVRDEIAASLECVHDDIPLDDALRKLSFQNAENLMHYAKTNGLKWTVDEKTNTLHFKPTEVKAQTIDAVVCARDMLEFTRNIETIV